MKTKCYYATFLSSPPNDYDYPSICLLFQTCTKLETTFQPNGLTSSYVAAMQCDTPGICVVSTYQINQLVWV